MVIFRGRPDVREGLIMRTGDYESMGGRKSVIKENYKSGTGWI